MGQDGRFSYGIVPRFWRDFQRQKGQGALIIDNLASLSALVAQTPEVKKNMSVPSLDACIRPDPVLNPLI